MQLLRRARLLGACVLIAASTSAYRNPVPVTTPTGERLETFADPAIMEAPDGSYYAYATSDPLNSADRDAAGALRIRRIPFARSTDLVSWTYAGAGHTADFDYVRVYRVGDGFTGAEPHGRSVRDARPGRVDRTPSASGPMQLREQLPTRR